MPTLANTLGLPTRTHWEGQDMFGARDPAGPVYATAKRNADWLIDLESIRLGDMKLIREYKTGITELYDLSSDPGELVNLANDQPAVAHTLTIMLHEHLLGNARANGADSVINAYPNSMLEEGCSLQLTAPAGTGHVWFKDGTPLPEEDVRITGVNSRTLDFSTTVISDMGIYECIYTDEVFSLNVTSPYIVNVLYMDSVPACNAVGVLLLALWLLIAACIYCGKKNTIYQ